jgi:fumarate reductase iron-sulfur subunit
VRYNPADPRSVPHQQTFELEQSEGMTLFVALNEIREKLDPSLQFDFVCRAGICGSCGMVINGKPGLACRTLTKNVGPDITLAPLPFFQMIGDLSVDTGTWMRGMSERLDTWVHMKEEKVDLKRIEEPMDPDLARRSTSSTAASSAAAAWRPAARRACARISWAPWGSTRSRATGSTRATSAPTRTTTS